MGRRHGRVRRRGEARRGSLVEAPRQRGAPAGGARPAGRPGPAVTVRLWAGLHPSEALRCWQTWKRASTILLQCFRC